MSSEFLTVTEVAGRWRVTPQTVYAWVREGKCAGLFFRTPSRRVLFYAEKIAETQGTPAEALISQIRHAAETRRSLEHHFGKEWVRKHMGAGVPR